MFLGEVAGPLATTGDGRFAVVAMSAFRVQVLDLEREIRVAAVTLDSAPAACAISWTAEPLRLVRSRAGSSSSASTESADRESAFCSSFCACLFLEHPYNPSPSAARKSRLNRWSLIPSSPVRVRAA